MVKQKSSEYDIAQLRQDIANLNTKVDALQMAVKQKEKSKPNWRRVAIGASAMVATLVLVLGNIFFWTGRTLVDTNRYVATVGPLIKQPPIQSAIASYTTTQIFNNFDVQAYIKSNLPPKASFLAPELTTQVKSYTQTSIKALLKNSKVQQYWYTSLARRHSALINFSKSYQGNGSIDVSDIYSQLSKRLSGTQLSFLANKQLPAKVGSIKIRTVGWLPAFHKLVNNIDLYQAIATILFVLSSGITIFLLSRRLRMVIKLGLVFAGFMLLTIISVRIMRGVFLSNINQQYQAAATSAYNTVLSSFITQTIYILIISLLISFGAWISGKYKLDHKVATYFSNSDTKPPTSKKPTAKKKK